MRRHRPRMVSVALLTILSLTAACFDGGGTHGRWVREGDTVMRDVQRAGRFADRDLTEASGVVASVGDPGVFWANNDSGNDERLFAFDRSGNALGHVRLRNAKNRDWEALTSGPCVDERTATCLYVGDIGDNRALRDAVEIYQVREPSRRAGQVLSGRSLLVRYADGAHDVEAMYMGPGGTLWLVTKRPERGSTGGARPSRVYEVPAAAWGQPGPYTASVVDSVAVTPVRGASHDWITDGSLSPVQPDGSRRLVLLSYGAVHVFSADPATGRPGPLRARCALPITDTAAEGVAWLPDGRILLVNEGKGGALYTGRCP